MSSTGRSDVRRKDDVYYTPEWCVRALLAGVPLPMGRWLEPAAGEGAIIRAASRAEYHRMAWTAIELREECGPAISAVCPHYAVGCDFLTDFDPKGTRFQVAITNPPYSLAREFVDRCREVADYTVMLLRLNFLGSQKRAAWFQAHQPSVYVLPKRPSFTGGKTDSCEYAWFVWGPVAQSTGHVKVLEIPQQRGFV